MNSKAAFPWKVSGGWRAHPGRLLGLALAMLMLGCGEEPPPKVAGMSHFLRFSEFEEDDWYTLDTGAGGTQSIQTDDRWQVSCGVNIPGSPWMYLTRKDHREVAQREPDSITIMFLRVRPESSPEVSVGAMLDDYYYVTGTCPVTFEPADDDPASGTFSAAACDVETRFEDEGRLEFAKFHVRNCDTEPYE